MLPRDISHQFDLGAYGETRAKKNSRNNKSSKCIYSCMGNGVPCSFSCGEDSLQISRVVAEILNTQSLTEDRRQEVNLKLGVRRGLALKKLNIETCLSESRTWI